MALDLEISWGLSPQGNILGDPVHDLFGELEYFGEGISFDGTSSPNKLTQPPEDEIQKPGKTVTPKSGVTVDGKLSVTDTDHLAQETLEFLNQLTENGGDMLVDFMENKMDFTLLDGLLNDESEPLECSEVKVEENESAAETILQGILDGDVDNDSLPAVVHIEESSLLGYASGSDIGSPASTSGYASSTVSSPSTVSDSDVDYTIDEYVPKATTRKRGRPAGSAAPYTKPAGGVLNKKERKRGQNRTAAARYRQKKKQEADGVQGDLQELEQRNGVLKKQVNDLEYETQYLKSLIAKIPNLSQRARELGVCF